MAKKFLVNIDLGGNQLLNALAHPQSSTPTAYGKGQLWFDSTNNQLNVYNGTSFQPLATGGTAVTSLNGYTGGVTLYGTASQVTVTNTGTGSVTLSLPSTVSLTTACATNFYGAFNGNATTATNSTQLGGQTSTYYAPIASPTFTGTVNLGSNIATGSVTTATNSASLNNQPASYYYPASSITTASVAYANNSASLNGQPASYYYPASSITTASVTYATNAGNSSTTSQTNFSALTISGANVATQSYVTGLGYASNTNPNFTTGASVAGNRIITTADTLAAHAATTSSQLAGIITDETGTGNLVFNTSPSFVTPNIGSATGSVTYATTAGNANTVTNGVYTSDTGTVTSTMILNGTILDTDINATAGIAVSKLSASQVTIGSTAIGLGTTATTIAGLTTACATNFYGAFNGNATTATTATNLSGGTVNATTGSFSSTLNVTGTSTLGTTNTGALTATTGSFSSTLNVTGTSTLGATNVGALTATSGTIGGNNIATSANNLGFFATGGSINPANITTTGDVTIGGTLYLSGSSTYVSSSITVIQDPMIYLGHDNPTNIWDLGFVASFTSPQYQHTGFVRDHNLTNTWRLFSGAAEPANASVNFAGASVIHDTLALGSWQTMSGSGTGTVTASITNAGFLTAPSANFTSTLQFNGAAVATQAYVAANAPAKYTGTITGTGSLNSFTVTHNLGTRNVIVQVYQTSATPDTQYAEVELDIVRTTASAVTVNFASNVANGDTYNVVVLG